ncbi:gliding motility protein GldL [Bacteroidales bacterium OttesenSCG-928-A17]|nr:gliding motility protein GldL [Bacteroidales bacterium OttesenSCG-928-A17]
MGFKRRYKNFVEKFLAGEQGNRFFHIFYNLGAAVVIIGALAKITHWPWGLGNILLTVGLLTECFVFFISAFDKPAREWMWDRIFPALDTNSDADRPNFNGGGGGGIIGGSGVVGDISDISGGKGGVSGGGGGTIIVGGAPFSSGSGMPGGRPAGPTSATEAVENMTPGQVRQSFGIPNAVNISEEDSNALTASIKKMAAAADQLGKMAEMTDATQDYLNQIGNMAEDIRKFSEVTNNLTEVSDILLNSYRSITDNSDGINQSSRGYVHQMEALNRNIQGLNTIYEIQLKSVSSQIDAIERINAGLMRIKDLYEGSMVDSSVFRSETEKMAQQLQQLNGVYSRLLNAMTVNMYNHPNYPPQGGYNPNQQNP